MFWIFLFWNIVCPTSVHTLAKYNEFLLLLKKRFIALLYLLTLLIARKEILKFFRWTYRNSVINFSNTKKNVWKEIKLVMQNSINFKLCVWCHSANSTCQRLTHQNKNRGLFFEERCFWTAAIQGRNLLHFKLTDHYGAAHAFTLRCFEGTVTKMFSWQIFMASATIGCVTKNRGAVSSLFWM